MKLHFDEIADALYLRFDDSEIINSEQVAPGIILDFNNVNQVIGLEFLNIGQRISKQQLKQIEFSVT